LVLMEAVCFETSGMMTLEFTPFKAFLIALALLDNDYRADLLDEELTSPDRADMSNDSIPRPSRSDFRDGTSRMLASAFQRSVRSSNVDFMFDRL